MTNAICQHLTWSKEHEEILLCDVSFSLHSKSYQVARFNHLANEEIEAQGK